MYYQDLRELPVDAITGATPISANGGESGGLLGVSRELVDSQFGSYSYREPAGRSAIVRPVRCSGSIDNR